MSIQSDVNKALNIGNGLAVGAAKVKSDKAKEAGKEAEAKARAEYVANLQKQATMAKAKEAGIRLDLKKMKVAPEDTERFVNGEKLGILKPNNMLHLTGRGQNRMSVAKARSQIALAESYTSRIINDEGLAMRLASLAGNPYNMAKAFEKAKGGKL